MPDVVGLLAFVAVIICAIALSGFSDSASASVSDNSMLQQQAPGMLFAPPQPIIIQTGGGVAPADNSRRVWTLQRGHDYGAHEYIDTEGYLQGFTNDVVTAVCAAAGIDCRLVWDKYQNCWDSAEGEHSHGGKGLLGGWYDACMGWYTTLDRIHVFSFSQAYLKPPASHFYVKANDLAFSATSVQGKTIGFLDGWASDEKCLARQQNVDGGFLPKGSVKHFNDPKSLKQAILDGTVAAGFATYESMEQFIGSNPELRKVPQEFKCLIDGNALMTRKDSAFISLWNEGFKKIRSNGQFKKLCEEGKKQHGTYGSIDCVDS